MRKTTPGPWMEIPCWQSLADSDKDQLRKTAAVLVGCCGCAESLLDRLRGETQTAHIPPEFAICFATRIAVRLAISHYRLGGCSCRTAPSDGTLPLAFLPWAERTAFVLRAVLRYSRRDTALLMEMTDAQVDRLVTMAQRRGVQLHARVEAYLAQSIPSPSPPRPASAPRLLPPPQRRFGLRDSSNPPISQLPTSRAV